MSLPDEESAFTKLPQYKLILKLLIRKQIQFLLDQLVLQTGDESILLTANGTTRISYSLGTQTGHAFVKDRDDITQQFLNHCIESNPSCQTPVSQSETSQKPIHQVPARKPRQATCRSAPYYIADRSEPVRIESQPYHVQDRSSSVSDKQSVQDCLQDKIEDVGTPNTIHLTSYSSSQKSDDVDLTAGVITEDAHEFEMTRESVDAKKLDKVGKRTSTNIVAGGEQDLDKSISREKTINENHVLSGINQEHMRKNVNTSLDSGSSERQLCTNINTGYTEQNPVSDDFGNFSSQPGPSKVSLHDYGTPNMSVTNANSENLQGSDFCPIIKVEPLDDCDSDVFQASLQSSDYVGLGVGALGIPGVEGTPGTCPFMGPVRFVRKFHRKERTILTLTEKVQILHDWESGTETSQRKLANKYNISKTAVSDMIKNRNLLLQQYEINANTKRKRFNTTSKYADVNEIVWQWFKVARESGIQMSGPMIQEKALDVAKMLQITDFKASNGWLHSWRGRYNVQSYRDTVEMPGAASMVNDQSHGLNLDDLMYVDYGRLSQNLPASVSETVQPSDPNISAVSETLSDVISSDSLDMSQNDNQ